MSDKAWWKAQALRLSERYGRKMMVVMDAQGSFSTWYSNFVIKSPSHECVWDTKSLSVAVWRGARDAKTSY